MMSALPGMSLPPINMASGPAWTGPQQQGGGVISGGTGLASVMGRGMSIQTVLLLVAAGFALVWWSGGRRRSRRG